MKKITGVNGGYRPKEIPKRGRLWDVPSSFSFIPEKSPMNVTKQPKGTAVSEISFPKVASF